MTEYELLYVAGGDETEDASTKVTDAVNSAILKIGGKVLSEDAWGRRRLAYEIDKQDYGWYTVTRFSLEALQTNELMAQLRLNDKIIRTVLLRADELPSDEDRERAEEAAKSPRDARDTKRPSAKADPGAKTETQAASEKSAPKSTVKPADTKTNEEPEEPKKKETATEKKARQTKLDESLGELLKEEE